MQQLKLTDEQKIEIERRIHRAGAAQRVFQGADGELILNELRAFCGDSTDTFDADPYQNAYNCGKKAIMIFINKLLKDDPVKAVEKLKEYTDAKGSQGAE